MTDVKLDDNEVISGTVTESSDGETVIVQNSSGVYSIPIHSVKYIRVDNP